MPVDRVPASRWVYSMFGDRWRGMMLYKLNQHVFVGIAGMLTYHRVIANHHFVCNRVCYYAVRLEEVGRIERPTRGRARRKR